MGPPGAPFRLGPGAKCPSCPPLWAALCMGAQMIGQTQVVVVLYLSSIVELKIFIEKIG